MQTDWPDILVLFFLRAVEFICLCYLLAPLEKRKSGNLMTAIQIVTASVALTLLHELAMLGNWEGEFVYINFIYYPVVLAFILARYELSFREGIYFTLLFFLCVHSLRPLAMRISTLLVSANYLVYGSNPIWNLVVLSGYTGFLMLEFTVLKKYTYRYPKHKLTWPQLLLIVIATIPVVYITNLFLVLNLDRTNLPLSVYVISVLSSFCGMTIVIGYNNTLALARYQQDMLMLESLLASQQKQFEVRKETIELINTKYHDLKKHISFVASLETAGERDKYLDEIKSQLSIYDAFHDTGNDTLDIVLSDYDMKCRRNGIELLLFIDGKKLNFLQKLDVVTIFGNALENSIEAVMKLPPEQRSVVVRMREYQNWLILTFENTYDGQTKWKGNRLVSSKMDNSEHGYGMISIETTAAKYGGNVTVDEKDDQFLLTILFPLQSGE